MEVTIKPGDLSVMEEMEEFVSVVCSRAHHANVLNVSLENTTKLNLAQFNSLVKLYVRLRRSGQTLVYSNFPSFVQSITSKTRLDNVFGS